MLTPDVNESASTIPDNDPHAETRSYTRLEADHAALVRERDALAAENARLRQQLHGIAMYAQEIASLELTASYAANGLLEKFENLAKSIKASFQEPAS